MDSPQHQSSEHEQILEPVGLPKKSYRRKYRKIMVNFEEKMRESTTLFREEQRIFDISQRLAEQTDQIMQMILDLNSCPQVPPRLRYDLKPPGNVIINSSRLKTISDENEGHIALRKGRYEVKTGNKSLTEYRELRDRVLDNPDFVPKSSYSKLSASATVPHIRPDENLESPVGQITGFLTPKQEEQYIQGVDSSLVATTTAARPFAANNLANRNVDRTAERDRDMQLENPVSVYNWLRKHQPQVFLQDNEMSTEKPSKTSGSRSSRRTTTNRDSIVKQEQDMYDDDGIALEQGTSSRGKRKRDDDGGYRPRGGNSRSAKRKKEEGGSSGKRAKSIL